jgi:hypothetical protein
MTVNVGKLFALGLVAENAESLRHVGDFDRLKQICMRRESINECTQFKVIEVRDPLRQLLHPRGAIIIITHVGRPNVAMFQTNCVVQLNEMKERHVVKSLSSSC